VVYFSQKYEKEITTNFGGLPVIEKLSTTFLVGVEELKSWTLTIQETTTPSTLEAPALKVENKSAITIRSSWNSEQVLQKLEEKGFKGGKLEKAKIYMNYIDAHKVLAIQEMYFNEVWASIKLAQALLESDAGASKLAKASNNHFGIKARLTKIGLQKVQQKQYDDLNDTDFLITQPAKGVYNITDDYPYDRFETYLQVADSYTRHSNLVRKDCTMGNIGCYSWIWTYFPPFENYDLTTFDSFLATFKKNNPNEWFPGQTEIPYYAAAAIGLKVSGYATSKTYHQKIAYIIDTYELWRFDYAVWNSKQ
jgi:flagellum-specific peptidoglycan hydrolase FlgJ